MNIDGLECSVDCSTFNSTVWLYGFMGTSVLKNLNEPQKCIIKRAWSDVCYDIVPGCMPEPKIDSKINAYYDTFIKA